MFWEPSLKNFEKKELIKEIRIVSNPFKGSVMKIAAAPQRGVAAA